MKPMTRAVLACLAGLSLAAVAACGSDNGAKKTTATKKVDCAKGEIAGAGSTFQQNMQQQWLTDYAAKCAGAKINYQGTGSGAGIEQFGSGTIDFAGSDVTMKPDEQSKADATCGSKAVHVPVTAGGVAIMYNVKGLTSLNLSAKVLADIFQGTIKKWDDPAIAADNSGSLPSTPIAAYHRSDGSGTTKVFSGFEDANSGGAWKLGVDKQLNWPGGQAAKGSDGVTAGVKQTDGAITYVEVSFAKANSLPTAKVKGAGSDFLDLTGETVSKFLAASFKITGAGNDLGGKLDFAGTVGYPISTVSYVIVCEKYKDAAKGKLVKAYLSYAVGDGQSAADKLGYARLPSAIGDRAKTAAKALA